MPLSDRDYMKGEHPPYCTCVDCVNKRLKRSGIKPQKYSKSHKDKFKATYSHKKSEYHPPTLRLGTRDKQTHIKDNYPRHVNIIANIIIGLIVILVIGFLGGSIYGITKYYGDVAHWISEEYHSLENTVTTFIEDIPNILDTTKGKVTNSDVIKTIADAVNDINTPKYETIKPSAPTPTIPQPNPPIIPTDDYLTLFNQYRIIHKLNPLEVDQRLQDIAKQRAREIALPNNFNHDGIKQYNLGENIAKLAYSSDSDWVLLQLWIHSPGHQANILNPEYMKTGFARYGKYAVQVFTSRY